MTLGVGNTYGPGLGNTYDPKCGLGGEYFWPSTTLKEMCDKFEGAI
jgi:hypothetical protein